MNRDEARDIIEALSDFTNPRVTEALWLAQVALTHLELPSSPFHPLAPGVPSPASTNWKPRTTPNVLVSSVPLVATAGNPKRRPKSFSPPLRTLQIP